MSLEPESLGVRSHSALQAALHATDNEIRRAAPRVGEHNEEIYSEELGLSPKEIAELQSEQVI